MRQKARMNLDLLDRFLLLAEEQELDIVIVINKIDKDKKENYLAAAEMYRDAGYAVICTSAEKEIGIDALRTALENKISVFAISLSGSWQQQSIKPSGLGIKYRRNQRKRYSAGSTPRDMQS